MRLSAFSLAGLLVEAGASVSGIAQVTPRASMDPQLKTIGEHCLDERVQGFVRRRTLEATAEMLSRSRANHRK